MMPKKSTVKKRKNVEPYNPYEKLDRNGKYRYFTLELYTDNENHQSIIKYLGSLACDIKAVGILHNLDVYETGDKEGQFKKAHYHFVLRFSNQRYISGLASELGMEENLIQPVKNYIGCLRYLLHYDNPEKYQYSASELVGNLKLEVLKAIDDESEESGLLLIFDWIDKEDIVDFCKFYRWGVSTPYWRLIKSNHRQIENYIYSHNDKAYKRMGYVK